MDISVHPNPVRLRTKLSYVVPVVVIIVHLWTSV